MTETTELTAAQIWTGECALRDQATKALTALLPGFTFKAANVRNEWHKDIQHCTLRVTNDPRVSYTLQFRHAPVRTSRSIYSRRHVKRVFIVAGESYDAIGTRRRTTPHFEPRKDGSYNFEALAANIREALERKLYDHERHTISQSNRSMSCDNFGTVRDALGLKPREYSPTSATHEVGDFTLDVQAGDYTGGKVRCALKLKNEYMTPEEIIVLVRKLETLK